MRSQAQILTVNRRHGCCGHFPTRTRPILYREDGGSRFYRGFHSIIKRNCYSSFSLLQWCLVVYPFVFGTMIFSRGSRGDWHPRGRSPSIKVHSMPWARTKVDIFWLLHDGWANACAMFLCAPFHFTRTFRLSGGWLHLGRP